MNDLIWVKYRSPGEGWNIRSNGWEVMPYPRNQDLPRSVRNNLPAHAQDIYREAFNHAFAAHDGDPRQEEASHRIAWAAVKRSYEKAEGQWTLRSTR